MTKTELDEQLKQEIGQYHPQETLNGPVFDSRAITNRVKWCRQNWYVQTRFCPQIKYTKGENRKFYLRLRLFSADPGLENLILNRVYLHIDCLEYHKYVLTLSKTWSYRKKPGPGKLYCVTGWFEVFNLILGCLPFERKSLWDF